MRITFLTHFPGRGGSTSMLLDALHFFRSRGHQTSVVVGSDSSDPQIDSYKAFQPSSGAGWRQRLREYRALVESTDPEVIYFVSGVEEGDLLRFLPYVRVRHVFTLEQHDWLEMPYWLKQLGDYWEALTANTPDVLDEVSRFTRSDYAKLFVPYWLDASFYKMSKDAVPPRVRNPVEVCCIGRIEEYQKQMHWLPQIIEECKRAERNLVWHIYGAGPYESRFREEINRRNCLGVVHLHGWLDSQTLASRAASHDVYFSCSRFDGLPVAMLEAMFCGLACVVPSLPGGIRYIVENKGAFGYIAKSPADSVKALLSATADLDRLYQLKGHAREAAHNLFGVDVVRRKYLELESTIQQLKFNGRVLNIDAAPKVESVRWPTFVRRQFLRKGWPRFIQRTIGGRV